MRARSVCPSAPTQVKRSVRIGFGLVSACYTASGVATVAVSAYFIRTSDTSRRSVILTPNVLYSLLAAGIYIIASATVGVMGALAPLRRKSWLTAYVWLVVGAILINTGIGIWMWARTLDIGDLYAHNWRHLWPEPVRRSFQDQGSCCGYLNPRDRPASGSPSCANAATRYGCMMSVHQYTHNNLAYIYSWLFGFVFVAVVALLSALVMLVVRNDAERLRWSRANAIFRSMKSANPDIVFFAPEPKLVSAPPRRYFPDKMQ
ncbi:hypothetical protein LPJ61_003679 [Coemansia biformis]|uniref:Tetraspanin Tsp2 n=1 Tax=Coemansia biformis TaxID=1286918 RepID=A0A9W7Y661_9FUNG|nr:hypothetical protein LPJ61_003679 [Coemansia biformis]